MDVSTELQHYTNQAITLKNRALSAYQPFLSDITPSSEAGLNGLVDSAAMLFNYMPLLTQKTSIETRKKIMELLENLQRQHQQLDHSQDITIAAHYLLCATLDDILRCSGNHESQFLHKFHNSRVDQEKFYSILELISSQPEKYIDLLELAYLCLRFGYKGQYRNTPFGLQQWSRMTDNTYRIISQIRGRHSQILSMPSSFHGPSLKTAGPQKKRKKYKRFYLFTSLGFILLTITMGIVFEQTYDTTRSALMTQEAPA